MPPGFERPNAAGRSGPRSRPAASTRRIPPPRRKGTPPAVLALLIIVPILGIGITLLINRPFGDDEPVQTTVVDPNKDIDALADRFSKLEKEYQTVLRMDREAADFELRAKSLIAAFDTWMDDYEVVIGTKRGPDGQLAPEFFGYSRLKARAGQYRLDLIKSSGF